MNPVHLARFVGKLILATYIAAKVVAVAAIIGGTVGLVATVVMLIK